MSRRKAPAGRGWFSLRPDGAWIGRVMIDGRPHAVSAGTQQEAIAKLDALQAAVGGGLEAPSARLTVGRFLEDWADSPPVSRSVSADCTFAGVSVPAVRRRPE